MLSSAPRLPLLGLAVLLAPGLPAQQAEPFEEPPIRYSATEAKDRATALNAVLVLNVLQK